jgi:hypothetical protein
MFFGFWSEMDLSRHYFPLVTIDHTGPLSSCFYFIISFICQHPSPPLLPSALARLCASSCSATEDIKWAWHAPYTPAAGMPPAISDCCPYVHFWDTDRNVTLLAVDIL